MEPADQQRLAEALAFALDAHGRQKRKGKSVPYASHLLQVAGLVLEHGGDPELAAAGLLHDTIEDCERVDETLLRERFGGRVARIVASCTDLLEGDTPERKSDWKSRKTRYLAHLRAADRDTRLVAACDKLHNLGDLVADLQAHGPDTLSRFTATPEQTVWYYQSVRAALGDDLPQSLRERFDALLGELALRTRPTD